jgi:hypothetical protein
MKKQIWAAKISYDGLYSNKPIEVKEDTRFEAYYGKDGDFEIDKLGLHITKRNITFASENKAEIKTWISGAKALNTVLRNNILDGASYKIPEEITE